jgi:hypothetical protein
MGFSVQIDLIQTELSPGKWQEAARSPNGLRQVGKGVLIGKRQGGKSSPPLADGTNGSWEVNDGPTVSGVSVSATWPGLEWNDGLPTPKGRPISASAAKPG